MRQLLPALVSVLFAAAYAVQAEPLRRLPLKALRPGATLVAGERLSAYWAPGDSLRPLVQARTPKGSWRLVRKPDPTALGKLRADWRLPADLAGVVELRFCEPGLGAPLDSVRILVLTPAGSPATGPFLEQALEVLVPDSKASPEFIPYRTTAVLAEIHARLASASGGSRCLPDPAALQTRAAEDSRRFAGGMALLTSRVRYHYWDAGAGTARAAEFRGIGFASEDAASRKAVFLFGEASGFSNVDDPVVRVDIRIGSDTLSVTRGGQREYDFATDGMHTVFLRAFTAAGDSWTQATVVVVKAGEAEAEAVPNATESIRKASGSGDATP